MTRLQSEWRRLYLPEAPSATPRTTTTTTTSLSDAQGRVRALVLALGRPADWSLLASAWQGLQADLDLPAPAIAVSGVDSYQLWFSLREAVPIAEAHGFLTALRQRYLPSVAPGRIGLWPAMEGDAAEPDWDTRAMPGQEVRDGQWSAFVAPDLAPMFTETPWLDIPPSPEGQAELLARLQSIQPGEWHAALARLEPAATPDPMAQPAPPTQAPTQDPRQFLLRVMNDETVTLASRIEAAKALLPFVSPPGR